MQKEGKKCQKWRFCEEMKNIYKNPFLAFLSLQVGRFPAKEKIHHIWNVLESFQVSCFFPKKISD